MLKQLRVITVAAATAGLVLAGAMTATATPPGSVDGGVQGHKVTICHATNSNTNPYVKITVDVASILNNHGHDGHDGPVWESSLKSQHITWGDIIPAFTYTAASGSAEEYPGKNLQSGGEFRLANGCIAAPIG